MIRPMLAKPDVLPVGEDWLYEIKWDGVRCTATVSKGQVTMQSRSSKSNYVSRFPEIADALSRLPDCVIDGEIVTMDPDGHTFGLKPGRTASFIVFDLLELSVGNASDGRPRDELRQWPLRARRELLRQEVEKLAHPRVALSEAFDDGPALLAWAAEHGIEGIVAKRRSSTYRDGARCEDWIKVKVRPEQEFVVVGWVPGKNGRTGRIGGLLLAYYDGDQLVYAGRTGNSAKFDREMETRLARVDASPLGQVPKDVPKERTWVHPDTVVQVAYQRWSDDRRLQHPSLKRIRDDKDARQVTVEGLES